MVFFTCFIFSLDCCKEIPQLRVPGGDDGAVAVPEERLHQGRVHQHLCSRQRNRASLRRRGQEAQQVLTAPSCVSVPPFTDSAPCCLKMYFILMLSGWHPYDFTCSKCIGQGQICLSLVKREGSSCCGVETVWSLIQDLAQLVLFAISIGNESTWLVSCSVLGVHHDLYSLEF